MSHHFDTKLAKDDPSLNLCDFYLFDGPSGKTVMAMTVNPDVGLSAPDTLHPEGLYAFRFDLNGDAREEVTFKFRFGEPRHGDGSEHTHIQPFTVRKATDDAALRGDSGESLVEGETGSVATNSNLRAFVGIAPELFAANTGFGTFMTAFHRTSATIGCLSASAESLCKAECYGDCAGSAERTDWEGKNQRLGDDLPLCHAPEVQISRWGLPMVTHLFLNDPSDQEVKEQFNASVPSEDLERFAKSFADFSEKMTTYAGSAANPVIREADRCTALSQHVALRAWNVRRIEVASFNGRALGDDVLDVMLTLAANTPIVDGLAPDRGRIRRISRIMERHIRWRSRSG